MKRSLLIMFGLLLAGAAALALALFVPNSLPVHSDFSAIYYADMALVHGIPIYDLPAVEAMAVQVSGIPPEHFFLPRFPYPPWFALSTFYLGLLPIQAAAALWFELNLAMLFISLWLLTDGWPPRLRLFSFPLALVFLPVLGALSVGQYDFPVLLGLALLIYALKKEKAPLAALGMVLLTFKPHIGGLVLLAALAQLVSRRNAFGWQVLRLVALAGAAIFIVSFIADPGWPSSYPGMLLNYQNEGNVTACSECASVPVWLSRWLFDGSLAQAARIALVLLLLLSLTFATIRASLAKSPAFLLNAALLVTLLASPYLYNYDFLLLLVPMALFFHPTRGRLSRILILACYLLPTLAIAIWGRAGNISLIVATLLLAALLFREAHKKTRAELPTDRI